MSSLYVRQRTEQWLLDASLWVPYYSTINKEQSPRDDVWCTCRFGSSYRETLTFCNDSVEENGEIEIIYYGQPGVGYEKVIAQAERDLIIIMANRDPAQRLVFMNRSSLDEYSSGSADQQYAVSVFIDYVFYE